MWKNNDTSGFPSGVTDSLTNYPMVKLFISETYPQNAPNCHLSASLLIINSYPEITIYVPIPRAKKNSEETGRVFGWKFQVNLKTQKRKMHSWKKYHNATQRGIQRTRRTTSSGPWDCWHVWLLATAAKGDESSTRLLLFGLVGTCSSGWTSHDKQYNRSHVRKTTEK